MKVKMLYSMIFHNNDNIEPNYRVYDCYIFNYRYEMFLYDNKS